METEEQAGNGAAPEAVEAPVAPAVEEKEPTAEELREKFLLTLNAVAGRISTALSRVVELNLDVDKNAFLIMDTEDRRALVLAQQMTGKERPEARYLCALVEREHVPEVLDTFSMEAGAAMRLTWRGLPVAVIAHGTARLWFAARTADGGMSLAEP